MTRVFSPCLLAICCISLSLPSVSAQPFVEATPGDYPLILSAPHGGTLAPDSLMDRTCAACVTVRDSRTQEWARLLSDEIFDLTARRPSLVINLLARTKLDANREVSEAADGDPHAALAWAEYHEAIETAKTDITDRFGSGLLLDLHGHGHAILRFELGYLLSASKLRESNASLNGQASSSSLVSLAGRQGVSLSELVRGSESLGTMLDQAGIPSVPSASDPTPAVGDSFFSGGYITARHGSRDGGAVDAAQLEAYRVGARDSDANVSELARNVAVAVVAFLERWYPDAVGTGVKKLGSREIPQGECLTARQGSNSLRLRVHCPEWRQTEVLLYDATGRVVARTSLKSEAEIATAGLASGVYFLFAPGMNRALPMVLH